MQPVCRWILLISLLIMFGAGTVTPWSVAQTEIPGGTANGIVLSASQSPYLLTGSLEVIDLSIEPGVTVLVNGNYEIRVSGVLHAVGTVRDSIGFGAPDSVSGWQGIHFDESSHDCHLAYCWIERSVNSGLRLTRSVPTIRNCDIRRNSAHTGAGLRIEGDALVELVDCCIHANVYEGNGPAGGGIYSHAPLGLIRCQVADNSIDDHRSCFGQGNATTRGGGIYSRASLTLESVLIIGNRANSRGGAELSLGGGIYVEDTLIMRNCVIAQNAASAGGCNIGGGARGDGGGVYAKKHLSLTNCILTENSTRSRGGGLYADAGGEARNCTIAQNQISSAAGVAGAGIRCNAPGLALSNCIIYSNRRGASSSQISGTPLVTYSSVEGGYAGEGNIDSDPLLFLNPQVAWDVSILEFSPCVDAGNPAPEFNDRCHPPSFGGSRNDMGAHGGPQACDWNLEWSFSSYAFGTALPERRYFLMSLPLGVPTGTRLSSVLHSLGEPGLYSWRGFGVTPEGVIENPLVLPGHAYWVASASPAVDIRIAGVEFAEPVSVEIDSAGFWAVGVPDLTRIFRWSDVQVTAQDVTYSFGSDTLLTPGVWWYEDESADLVNNGQWGFASADTAYTDANPWRGYLIYAHEPCRLTFPSEDAARRMYPPPTVAAPPEIWTLELSVSSGDSHDSGIRVGTRSGSRDGVDRRDVPKPHFGYAGVRMAVRHDQTPGLEYMASFDGPRGSDHDWDLIITGEDNLATLQWSSPASIPDSFEVFLFDEKHRPVANIREDTHYRFVLSGERLFRLSVSTRPTYYRKPDTRWLGARPNPTRGPLSIEFELAEAAQVQIQLLDLTGRRVSTLFSGALDRGLQAIPCVYEREASMGSGVYFLRLKIGSDVIVQKQMFLQ